MSIFNIFKKRIKITTENQPGNFETPRMLYHRTIITKKFENCLSDIDKIRNDSKMSPEQKYAIMMASLMLISKISNELLEENKFFSNDKQFESVIKSIEKIKRKESDYIG